VSGLVIGGPGSSVDLLIVVLIIRNGFVVDLSFRRARGVGSGGAAGDGALMGSVDVDLAVTRLFADVDIHLKATPSKTGRFSFRNEGGRTQGSIDEPEAARTE
jgi:hypothetical protein